MERTEDQKRRESVAPFRHALIGDLVHEHQGLYARLRAKADLDYEIPVSKRRRVAVETLRDWLRLYRKGRFEALLPRREAITVYAGRCRGS